MPKCKKCGAKMPKDFSYCGVCGADLATGIVPIIKDIPTADDSSTTKSANPIKKDTTPISTEIPKVSMTPSQDINAFIENDSVETTQPTRPIQTTPVVAPPQQKFTPKTDDSVQPIQTTPTTTRPIQTTPVVAPPQQKFTPKTDDSVQPIQTTPTTTRPIQTTPVVAPPQQKFTPKTDDSVQPIQTTPTTTRPIQTTPVVAPPQQKFTPKTDDSVQPIQTTPTTTRPIQTTPVVAPPQQKFTPKTDDSVQPIQTTPTTTRPIQTTPVQPNTPKPAYIPKPTTSSAIEMVKVPNLVEINQDSARQQLEKLGLKVIIETDTSSVVKPNAVISQSIATGTNVATGTAIKIVVSVGTWSNWSVDRVLDTNMYVIEQKKEFRFRSRTREIETHESSERNLPGYTCIDQRNVYSDWEDEGYYTTEDRETSETCDISTNLIGFKYCGYSYVGERSNIDMCYSTKQTALIFNPDTNPDDWQYVETVLYQDIPSETVDWYPTNDTERSTPAGDIIDCNIKMSSYFVDGKRYAMKYGSLGTEWFLYHRRKAIETVYTYKREYFTEWSEWSNWTDKAVRQDELNEVEARILYRSRRKTTKDLH